jgi:hypothetical protein
VEYLAFEKLQPHRPCDTARLQAAPPTGMESEKDFKWSKTQHANAIRYVPSR